MTVHTYHDDVKLGNSVAYAGPTRVGSPLEQRSVLRPRDEISRDGTLATKLVRSSF
jgi:hypothetical protein